MGTLDFPAVGRMLATPPRARWVRGAALTTGCLALAALTLTLPSVPSYDPWAWLVWGREVLAGDLHTATGPSWKPLPILFTAPFSLFGDAAPALWLVVARAGAFGALIAAAAVGGRLAGRLGAALGGGLLLFVPGLRGPVWLGSSEGILILCVLGAVDRHLAGRFGQAFALGVAAGLLRPEAWPFVGAYGLWLLAREPGRRGWIAAGLALLPALWLLPELWGSGSLWRGAERAQMPGPDAPALAARPALALLENAVAATHVVVAVGLLAGLAMVMLRRAPGEALEPAFWLAALGLGWLALVAVMTELGFSGIERYLLAPFAIAHVLAGAGLAWTSAALSRPLRRPKLGIGVTCLFAAVAMVAVARGVALDAPGTVNGLAREAAVTEDLDNAIARAGGERRLEACGSLHASLLLTSAVAWKLNLHLEEVTAAPRVPGVVMRARLLLDEPIDPPANALAGAPGRRIIARTKYWEVEAACHGLDGAS